MFVRLGMLLLLSLLAARVRAEPPSVQQRYELEARLDVAARAIEGRVRIRFVNSSERPLRALLFHLYLNAFASKESVFMRESRGVLRGQRAGDEGAVRLRALRVDGADLLASAKRELVRGDFTQLELPLASPLPPGAIAHIEGEFRAELPRVFARSGYAGDDFFAVAQWFPKLAKLEPDGSFVSFPYHGLGEFYADFADYALTVRVPHEFAVVATGSEVETVREESERRYRFAARAVHDCAFVAVRGFDHAQRRMNGVAVHFVTPPGYDGALPLHERVVAEGLRHYGRAFGPYAYPDLTVVLPPRAARGAAAMEYPTLFFSAGEWLTWARLPSLSGAVVTAHELAHQWFQGMIANDEVHHPVLDEGLAEWASLDLLRLVFGAREGVPGLTFDRFEIERLFARLGPSTASGLSAYEYAPGEYAASVYARAAVALESIRRAHGAARFERALRTYGERARFSHPTPATLAEAFDREYGAGFSSAVLTPLLFEGAISAVHLVEVRRVVREHGHATRVHARRTGAVALPTHVALLAADGRELARRPFPARQASFLATLATPEPAARVVVDPDRSLLVDPDVRDQVVELGGVSRSGTFLPRAIALAQTLLAWLGP